MRTLHWLQADRERAILYTHVRTARTIETQVVNAVREHGIDEYMRRRQLRQEISNALSAAGYTLLDIFPAWFLHGLLEGVPANELLKEDDTSNDLLLGVPGVDSDPAEDTPQKRGHDAFYEDVLSTAGVRRSTRRKTEKSR